MNITATNALSQHDQLLKTLLKQVRESPFKSDLFNGGRGGQAFGAMYDQQLAERMTRSAGEKLVRSIVRRIEAHRAYARQDLGRAGSSSAHRGAHVPPAR
jgi:Rod binding domain-containing protein